MRKRKAAEEIEAELAALESQLRGEQHKDESAMPPLEVGMEREIQEMAAD